MTSPTINPQLLSSDAWNDTESQNVKTVTRFVELLMNEHDFDAVLAAFNNDRYRQHNRNLPEGIEGLVGFLRGFTEKFPEYSYDVKRIFADGNHVVFHSHATMKAADRGDDGKGWNIVDVWKVEDGKIVEHWDSIQSLDLMMRLYSVVAGGNVRNANGVF
ncbi:MAG: nuclear transport factor 2 family protein [Pseudomonadota bacterium]